MDGQYKGQVRLYRLISHVECGAASGLRLYCYLITLIAVISL